MASIGRFKPQWVVAFFMMLLGVPLAPCFSLDSHSEGVARQRYSPASCPLLNEYDLYAHPGPSPHRLRQSLSHTKTNGSMLTLADPKQKGKRSSIRAVQMPRFSAAFPRKTNAICRTANLFSLEVRSMPGCLRP
jgi:hypothetical protein